MNTTPCNHTEAIAKELYSLYLATLEPCESIDWDSLHQREHQAWIKLAGNLLPILGRHALSDLASYTKFRIKKNSTLGKKILWGLVGTIILAMASWLASLSLTSCGHTISASPEKGFVICKDGTCLIIKEGKISYGPNPNETSSPVATDGK